MVQSLQKVVHFRCHTTHDRTAVLEVEAGQFLKAAANEQKGKQHSAHKRYRGASDGHVVNTPLGKCCARVRGLSCLVKTSNFCVQVLCIALVRGNNMGRRCVHTFTFELPGVPRT